MSEAKIDTFLQIDYCTPTSLGLRPFLYGEMTNGKASGIWIRFDANGQIIEQIEADGTILDKLLKVEKLSGKTPKRKRIKKKQ